MLITHETGHVVGGWLSGGRLVSAELRPWHLPYSIFAPDPRPLVTLWAGLISGVLAPLLFALAIRKNWTRLMAGFCLLANGFYIAIGWWSGDPYLDTTKLLEHGAHPISLTAYCAATIVCGYYLFRSACVEIWKAGGNQPTQAIVPLQDSTEIS
jgi:hypothetical protein